MSDVTLILQSIEAGDPQAAAQLLPLIYDELRKLAEQKMAAERKDHTLHGTALVHEAYLRLVGSEQEHHWNGRGHFFAAAAEAMRRILIDHARQRKSQKRSDDANGLRYDTYVSHVSLSMDDLLDFNEALSRLEISDSQAAQIVKLRVFAGLSVKDAAASLGIPERSAFRDWSFAQAWLFRELNANAS